jgi:ribosomal protein L1
MSDEQILTNMQTLYDAVVHNLPKEHNNVGSVVVKLTMGKPVKVI